MRAIVCQEYGPPESLKLIDLADPIARPGQAVVDVAFAAVNYPDVLMIANRYQVSIPPPFVPGSEFSGVVVAVGEGVDTVQPGDHVFGASMTGAFSEQIVVPATALRKVPEAIALEAAAAFWIAHATAYHALRSIAEVQPGERVVVLGAAGGVGLAAVELAVLLGAQVIAAASTAELENDHPERAAAQLGQLSEAAREAYADVREGILGLRTSLGEDRGFIETLQDYLDRWQAQSDVTVELLLSPPGYDPGLAPMSEVQLLRIIQEALSNVRKHAKARRAWVRLRPAGTGVEVVIEDDGVGFDPDGLRRTDLPRFGMATMRERAEAVGGTFEIAAVPGAGTRVTVHLPTEPKAAKREETTVARADR